MYKGGILRANLAQCLADEDRQPALGGWSEITDRTLVVVVEHLEKRVGRVGAAKLDSSIL